MTGPEPGAVPGTVAAPRRSRENTRARLVAAAVDVFAEKSLRRVTVDDLVGAAGYTRGAFYSNFSTIDEVFLEAYTHQAEQMLAVVNAALDRVPAGEFSLASFRAVFDALHPLGRRWFLIQNEFALLAVRDPEARAQFVAHTEGLQGSMEDLVQRVLTLLDREPTVPLPELTDVLLALYVHSIGTEQLGTGNLVPDRLVGDVLPQVLLGLSRPRR